MISTKHELLSARLLISNVLSNFIGIGLPLIVGLICIPFIVKGMGVERFGLLTLFWMAMGYFSIFDLGIGRAMTKLISERLGMDSQDDLIKLVITGTKLMLFIGLFMCLITVLLSYPFVYFFYDISLDLKFETFVSILLFSITIPFIIQSSGYVGILQAYQSFKKINNVRLILGLFNYLSGLVAIQFHYSLFASVLLLAVARLVAWKVYKTYASTHIDVQGVTQSKQIDKSYQSKILHFGGWVSVSNILAPFMTFSDRFILGAVLTVKDIAYYSVPYDVVYRLMIIPEAITSVMFPAISMAISSDQSRLKQLYQDFGLVLMLMTFIPVFVIVLFAPQLLNLWLGQEFANQSATVMQIIAIGIFLNAAARLPFLVLQGSGRPDYVAKLQIIELPITIALLIILSKQWGIVGAASSWSIRVFIDLVALYVLAMILSKDLKSVFIKEILMINFIALFLCVCMFFEQTYMKVIVLVPIVLIASIIAFRLIIRVKQSKSQIGKNNG